jgi:hypothetical protein
LVLSILFAAALLPTLNLHPDGAPEYALEGTAHGPDNRVLPAILWISCWNTTSISVELEIHAIAPNADLPYGFLRAAQDKRLSHLNWITPERDAPISLAASSFRATDNPASLKFTIVEAKETPAPLLALLLTINGSGTFEWRQPAFNDVHELFSATFPVTSAMAKQVQLQIRACSEPPSGFM